MIKLFSHQKMFNLNNLLYKIIQKVSTITKKCIYVLQHIILSQNKSLVTEFLDDFYFKIASHWYGIVLIGLS